MVFFKMYMWDTHSFFGDFSFLLQSSGYVFLLLGSICTLSLAAEVSIPMDAAGENVPSHEAQIHSGFKDPCILYILDILVMGRMTKNLGGECTDAQLGMTEKWPNRFRSVFSGRISYINLCPDFC